MDTELSSFNINESLEELIALLNRFAHQKKITLEKQFEKELPLIQSNPSLLQLAVFNIIQDMMTRLDKNSNISLQTNVTNGHVSIRINIKGNLLATSQESAPDTLNDRIIKKLGGDFLQETEKGILIKLPKLLS